MMTKLNCLNAPPPPRLCPPKIPPEGRTATGTRTGSTAQRLAPRRARSYNPHKRLPESVMTFTHRHLLGIEHLRPEEIVTLLDLADDYVTLNQGDTKHSEVLAGLTQINMFFENSTRTQASFELAGKRLGADVMNMGMQASSIKKGETLIDTALTLNAMRPDLLVVRHPHSGAVDLLSQKVNCAVLNAGDGRHEHPTQALLDALTDRKSTRLNSSHVRTSRMPSSA